MQTSLPLAVVTSPRAGGPTDPSHDARLRRGIIDTDVSRRVAAGVTILFLTLVYAVPVAQAVVETLRGEESAVLDLFRHVPSTDRLRQLEKDLDQTSYAKDFVQPRMQLLLSRFGRVGNKRAVIGLGGWLYYKPGITFLAGPGFLDAAAIRNREKEGLDAGESVHADPRPGILAFHDMLVERGIELVLFPVPDKAMLQPRELSGRERRADPGPVARNPAWKQFVTELRTAGIAVFDPTPVLLHEGEEPRFLMQDTHWTPAWMEQVAGELAHFVAAIAPLPSPSPAPLFHAAPGRAERVGDLVDMLKLPEQQTLFAPQAVVLHEVADEAGTPWEPDPEGDVLLLGDSFTNVFSSEPMGWGTAAGLAPHLALALGRKLDVIAQNDSGAFATRQALARELAAGEDRLAGKRVVVWEFASRELSTGDWKPMVWGARAGHPLEGAR